MIAIHLVSCHYGAQYDFFRWQVALRPTLDDASSDDSSCDSSSDSSSDDDSIAAANSAAVGQDKHEATFTTHSDTNSALPNQTEALHHQWFWAAFISVQRLPGVPFCLSLSLA